MSVETEINDTLRRLTGLDELFRTYREMSDAPGITGSQVEVMVTLIDDIRAGAKRALDLFDAGLST